MAPLALAWWKRLFPLSLLSLLSLGRLDSAAAQGCRAMRLLYDKADIDQQPGWSERSQVIRCGSQSLSKWGATTSRVSLLLTTGTISKATPEPRHIKAHS